MQCIFTFFCGKMISMERINYTKELHIHSRQKQKIKATINPLSHYFLSLCTSKHVFVLITDPLFMTMQRLNISLDVSFENRGDKLKR